MATRHALVETVVGELTVIAEDSGVSGIFFPGHRYLPEASTFGATVNADDDEVLSQAAEQLAEYFAGARRSFDVPLAAHGDEFSEQVWALLREIPYGETTTYGELAVQLGNRHLAQRVGQAVGHNPVSIIIPCHRVIGADGSLTGYAGGLERKRWLLELEEPAGLRLF